ncbi:methyltransferase domain-containing protein [Montanilutibacter psychrotolerans]|uniref:Methyltransferase n=1 Tax=Montanilutibacter psychrotolerans TaxID=1327343 RepID=A0A3M8SQ60_9GAMM|nr:methyltransferase domain-containing protein [Lysobacter psychrotolerans]RNF82923.1 methyltransferase [Lysobacter psychrotolerans]
MPRSEGAATRPVDAGRARAIAQAFLSGSGFGRRWDYHYARSKLRSDPLYPGVCDALRGTREPLLDLGCGLGLLAHALRADGIGLDYRGVDNDAGKIDRAGQAATRAGLASARFDCVDLAAGIPTHRGSVAILDVLQFISPDAQQRTLDAAVAMLVPGAKLVIRTGLDDGGRRARVTRAVDVFSRVLGWMNAGPRAYPNADALRARFEAAGLQAEFTPLYGNTPFNNWRVVATLPG